MYFGVPIWVATSDNLIDWTPLETRAAGSSRCCHRGPAISIPGWSKRVARAAHRARHRVLYNAGNDKTYGDSTLPARVYTGGQALFDARNP